VRSRLRDAVHKDDKIKKANVAYIASMLSRARDCYVFGKFMEKDTLNEVPGSYQVVTSIRTRRDQIRLDYLLKNKLSTT